MGQEIEVILFDMGGTLRSTVSKSKSEKQELVRQMLDLLDVEFPLEEFTSMLAAHADAYRRWAQETLIELSESDLWTKWMLPDLPAGKIRDKAIQLNQLYRSLAGTKIVFPETRDVILELFRRGYRLGLVSNTTSSIEVPAALRDLNISGCFEVVILSTVVGMRKPDPAILLEATRRMGVAPENCAYIGDRVDRDVAAARRAGFSKAIIMRGTRHENNPEWGHDPHFVPDHVISNLTGLLDIFPKRSPPQPAVVYDVSLSTMWAMKNFPTLVDFFEVARRMGFARIELNHKVTTPMLEGIDPGQYQISSVHEPCPADVSEDELKKRDWLISSTNEANRNEGVNAIKRSISLAERVGAPVVIIHAGQTLPDHDRLEKKLRELLDAGQRDSDEFRTMHERMLRLRSENEAASFTSLRKSIQELLDYARPLHVQLGLENRFHFLEHPSPNELEILLGLAGQDQLGFIFDIGHAETLDRLGFYPGEEWLERFSSRIIGTHLHDVITTDDHYAAGLGDANFEAAARLLPENAFRTCEFQNFNSPEQVKAGLDFLVKHNCIKKL